MESSAFAKIITRVKMVILRPESFWKSQKKKNPTHTQLLGGYFIPLLLALALFVFLGEFFKSAHFYFAYAAGKALRAILLFTGLYFITVYAGGELITKFQGEKDIKTLRKLVIYSLTPMLVISAVTGLFSFFYVLDILGLYSFYIFWIGGRELLNMPEEQKNNYITLMVVIMFITFIILSIVLAKLFTAFV
jgi:hypothetical protein